MAIVGLNGNNAPDAIDGIDPRLWMGIQARAYTYHRREPFNPAFGLGLVDGLASERVSQAEWSRRIVDSFDQLEGATLRSQRVTIAGSRVRLEVQIDDTTVQVTV